MSEDKGEDKQLAACDQYNLLQWIGRERGKVDREVMLQMDTHRESCADCRNSSDLAREISRSDWLAAEPPESWLQEAATLFESFVPGDNAQLIAELTLDSYLENAEPMRAGLMTSRRLRFELPHLKVDLLLEYSGPQLEMVIGQLVLNHPDTKTQVHSLELRVDEELLTAKPNNFGEFLFSVKTPLSGSSLELKCIPKEGPCAVVLIPC